MSFQAIVDESAPSLQALVNESVEKEAGIRTMSIEDAAIRHREVFHFISCRVADFLTTHPGNWWMDKHYSFATAKMSVPAALLATPGKANRASCAKWLGA